MTARRIVTLFFSVFVLVDGRWHTQKREVTSICDPMSSSHSKVACYCMKNSRDSNLIKSADCFVTADSVKPNDYAWDGFEQLKTATKLTLTNSKGIALQYIPTHALKYLEVLVQLDVMYGNIKKVNRYAFANLSNIEEIGLRDSQIETLEPHAFANHKELTTIKLDKNNIGEINRDVFKNLPSLEKLFLTENQITTIHDHAFLHLETLKELEINMNKLFSLNSETFSGLKNLQKLDLSSNNLEVIGDNTFHPLKNLQSLNLDGNKIQMLDEKAFNGLSRLQHLTLAHNKISNNIDDEVFMKLEALSSLSLRGNEITELNTEAIAPLLNNFYEKNSHLDVEDNAFSCNCKLDWFVQLMNRTRSKVLKISLENLKCLPDSKLRDLWNNMEDTERNSGQVFDAEEGSQAGMEYEYYDESQLNGKLFYTDVRDLLNCGNNKPKMGTSARDIPILMETKGTSTSASVPSVTVTTAITTHKEVPTPNVPITNQHIEITNKPQTNFGLLDLSEAETSPKTKDVGENEIQAENKPNSFTTSRLVNVSAKPINVYDNMAADEAKPDKLKAQRSFQAEYKVMPSSGHNNVESIALLSMIFLSLFH